MISESKLVYLLQNVFQESDFYRQRFLTLGANHHNLTDYFEQLPLTTRSDLLTNIDHIKSRQREYVRICSTGGTSGNPLFVWRTKEEIMSAENTMKYLYETVGLKTGTIIGLMLPFGIWNIGHLCLGGAQLAKICAIPIGTNFPYDVLFNLLRQCEVNCIFTGPGLFARLNEAVLSKGLNPHSDLKFLKFFGQEKHFLKEREGQLKICGWQKSLVFMVQKKPMRLELNVKCSMVFIYLKMFFILKFSL